MYDTLQRKSTYEHNANSELTISAIPKRKDFEHNCHNNLYKKKFDTSVARSNEYH